MIKKLILFFACLFVLPVMAQDANDFQTTEEILEQIHNEKPTACASQIFLQALVKHRGEIEEDEPEFKVRAWAREAMTGDAETLKALLQCPELQNISDDTTVVFSPISFDFSPDGRTITINYSTQPKVLKQKLMLATKRSLPNGEPNPKLMDPNDPAKYMNTEPSWYAIMVVQHDSLKEFVGADKNNTLSVKYINDHIDEIYPRGYYCTSKSAIANDKDTINQVVREVVAVEDDSNDYYVAGDVNLEWVMYAEIAADIIITVATAGAGQVVTGSLKGMRATKTAVKLAKNANKLKKLPHVAKYAKSANKISSVARKAERLEKNIKNAKKYERALKNLENAKRANKATDIAKYQKEADEILQAAKKIDPSMTDDVLKNSKNVETEAKKLKDSVPELEKELANSRKNYSPEQLKEIDQYTDNAKYLDELLKYRNSLKAFKRPQTGNIITRNLKKVGAFAKSLKAANTGAKTMTKAGRVARAGMSSFSSKAKYWLTDVTLKHGARLARFERDAGLLYGAISFLGDMYDKTSSTSQEFSNGIEFKPLCLLSADDLEGQDNVVNYGMWLMWEGNSTDSADDDAAYLQAMDFASKFYYQLDEFQDAHGANCNVDIYVVHPIIRLDETNMEDPKGELFYLFMNDIPWSTADQFGAQVSNIEDWERTQAALEQQDPNNKNKKQNNDTSEQNQERVAAPESEQQTPENTNE
jgi:hypothetical protein